MQPQTQNHATRDALILTALDLFWQNSINAVSVDNICKAAAVRKGSFYHFFPSKVDLVLEVFETMEKTMRPLIEEIFAAHKPPLDRLKDYADFAYEHQVSLKKQTGKVLGCPLTSCGGEMSTQDERIRQKIEYLLDAKKGYFEQTIRDAIARGEADASLDPVITAREMSTYTMGLMSMAKIHNDLEIIRRDLLPGLLHHVSKKRT